MPKHFLLKKEGGLATLTFNRPEKRNPLNEEILLELDDLLCQLRDDAAIRALIFTGTGNTFCSGADLTLTKGVTDPYAREKIFTEFAPRRTRLVERVLTTLVNLEPVTIAAINGYAVGGGWALLLGCDVRIAVEEAEFWFPEVDLGAPLSQSMTAMLIAHVGPSRAKEVILTCRRYTATELLSLNLLNQVVAKEMFASTVAAFINKLGQKKSDAVVVSRATVNALSQGQTLLRPDLLLERN
jgi:enoyl-CoA hydratase/carnithine racemase